MSLSSGGWERVSPPSVSPAGSEASPAGCCSTVLMSVKVSVCHSGVRPLCLPGAGDDSLRLQLSMAPGRAGEFRLALRHGTGHGGTVAEFDLRTVHYEVKSPLCHELSLTAPPHDRISFNFLCEQEAKAWATVVMSSLREAHRVATGSVGDDGQQQTQSPAPTSSTEELCEELSRAIEVGEVQVAVVCAERLAHQQTLLSIQPSQTHYTHTQISLVVVVEDASSSCCVTVKVFPHTTVSALKQQVFVEYGFHPRVQRWVIGQCLCADSRSLASYGVQRDGDTAFLYLVSARQARLSRQVFQQDQDSALLTPASSMPTRSTDAQPVANGPAAARRPYSTLPTRLNHNHNSMGSSVGGAERLGLGEIRNLINMEMPQLNEALEASTSNVQLGWACPSCTYINKPTRPGCEMCSADRPEGYTVPGGYRPDALELRRIQQEKEAIRQYQQEKGRRVEQRASNSLQYNLDQDY